VLIGRAAGYRCVVDLELLADGLARPKVVRLLRAKGVGKRLPLLPSQASRLPGVGSKVEDDGRLNQRSDESLSRGEGVRQRHFVGGGPGRGDAP
jgi:hypothetical protein